MSRLDSHIRRLLAQRDCINHVAALIRDLPGPILELGLGSGRTFDHLRGGFPEREIFVFDLVLESHPVSSPDARHFIQGDFRATLPIALARIGRRAALAHCDIGSHDVAESRTLAADVAALLERLLLPGAIVLSDQEMSVAWEKLPLPEGIIEGRYYIYRFEGEAQADGESLRATADAISGS
jgi:hypothetical protein